MSLDLAICIIYIHDENKTTLFTKRSIIYRKISNISRTKSQNLNNSRLCPIHLRQVLSREWRCSWSSTDRRHDDVIKWKHFPRYWPFVRGIHRSPVNSPHKGQWRGALMFFFICTRINGWVNNGEAGDLRRHGAHYDVTVMDAPTTFEWSTILLPTNVRLIIEIWQ